MSVPAILVIGVPTDPPIEARLIVTLATLPVTVTLRRVMVVLGGLGLPLSLRITAGLEPGFITWIGIEDRL